MISAVILRGQVAGARRITQGGIEIDDPVESPRRSNPLIHGNALCLARCCPRSQALIGKNRRAENLEAACMRTSNDLLIASDDFIRCHLCSTPTRICIRSGSIRLPNIVGALE